VHESSAIRNKSKTRRTSLDSQDYGHQINRYSPAKVSGNGSSGKVRNCEARVYPGRERTLRAYIQSLILQLNNAYAID